MSNDRQLLTAADLGKIYQVSADTILKWHHTKLIPAEVAAGSVYRFSHEAVAEALRVNASIGKGRVRRKKRAEE